MRINLIVLSVIVVFSALAFSFSRFGFPKENHVATVSSRLVHMKAQGEGWISSTFEVTPWYVLQIHPKERSGTLVLMLGKSKHQPDRGPLIELSITTSHPYYSDFTGMRTGSIVAIKAENHTSCGGKYEWYILHPYCERI